MARRFTNDQSFLDLNPIVDLRMDSTGCYLRLPEPRLNLVSLRKTWSSLVDAFAAGHDTY
jgi:hypothetical protein